MYTLLAFFADLPCQTHDPTEPIENFGHITDPAQGSPTRVPRVNLTHRNYG